MKIVADKSTAYVVEGFSPVGELEALDGRDITPEAVKDADILIVGTATKVDEKLLAKSGVCFVGTATTGFDHIDIGYLKKKGIAFASAPGSNANSVAEFVVAALLEVGHKYDIALEGRTIGIIGVGRIGSRVAKKCASLGMKLFLNDPPLYRKTGDKKYLPLKELFDCDFITLHTPLTREGADKTYHLADEKFFNSLKDGSIFINTARGAVADTAAIKKAIKNSKLKAAVIDVWENEPDIDIELLKMAAIGTPHIAGYSHDGKAAGMVMVYRALCDYMMIKQERMVEDFLLAPTVAEIKIDSGEENQQEILRQTVKRIYDITKDDCSFRRVLKLSKNKRSFIFDRLRKTYRIRREFHNTTCVVATENTKGTEKKLEKKLKGIGFKVSESTKR
jgi:erythronate-4-phosphate dehydrogenase